MTDLTGEPVLYESLIAADLADVLDAAGPGAVIIGATVRTARRRTITLNAPDTTEQRAQLAEVVTIARAATPTETEEALALAEQDLADTVTARHGLRPWTPNRRTSTTSKRISVKRCCNGCGTPLGDLVEHDFTGDSTELADVRLECPVCLPAIVAAVRAEAARWAGFDLARNINKIINAGHGERATEMP